MSKNMHSNASKNIDRIDFILTMAAEENLYQLIELWKSRRKRGIEDGKVEYIYITKPGNSRLATTMALQRDKERNISPALKGLRIRGRVTGAEIIS